MRKSGYDEGYRRVVIQAAIEIYDSIVQADNLEKRPVYRSVKWKEEHEKKDDPNEKRENWYRTKHPQRVDGEEIYEAPLILDPTAEGKMEEEIVRVCKEFEASMGMRVKLAMRGGKKICQDAKSEPMGDGKCGRQECETCYNGGGGGGCMRKGSVYQYECQQCPLEHCSATYTGETSRGVYQRSLEHREAMTAQQPENPMVKHAMIQHGGTMPEFKLTALSSHRTPMERQNREGVQIMMGSGQITLNSRAEFYQIPIVRVVPVRGLQNDQQPHFPRAAPPSTSGN